MAKRILIVEDEKNIRVMYADILREEGYEVMEEGDGKEGLNQVLNGEWDLLLLDIMLPKLDGIELLKRMKIDPKTKDKPIVVLTNLEDNRIKETCFTLGVKEFIVKSNIIPSDIVLSVKKYIFNE